AARMDSNKAAPQQAAAAPAIRGEFADTAFWQAFFATDASGRGSVTVKLPDNLTTWVMRGVAASADTRVGEGLAEVVATRPLLIRPVAPRFFVVADQVELGANVSNNTDAPLKVEVSLAAKGLALTSPATQTIEVAAKGEANVTWQVTAQDVEQADLVFTAISGAYADASRPRLATGSDGTLNVLRYSVPETVGTAGQLAEPGNRTEAIGLPKDIDTRSGELTVRIEPSLAAGLQDTLDYLDQADYDSIEATISSFLPNVATHRALKKLGIANQELEAELPLQIEDSLTKLRLAQNQDGGWGWWAGDESNPHVSAYAVYGLIRARDSGWTVDETMLARGMDYLATQLADTASLDTPGEANRQAWLLYVLAEGGVPQQARQAELFEVRERLASYARALLALSLAKAGAAPDSSQIKALLADLNNGAIASATGAHWEEDGYDRWSMNTDTRSTAIILMALARLDPQNQLNPNVVRWLMVARQDGIWETSQESAWAVLALTDWMDVTGELNADYDYAAFINEKELAAGRFGQADVLKPVVLKVAVKDLLVDAGNRLTVSRGAGPGRAYYAAHLRAFLPVESVKALDRGVSVRRRYTLASCEDGPKCPAVDAIKVGDVVRVDISVTAPNDLYYLQLEDPIPAGAEIIDTSLATTSVLEQAPGLSRDNPGFPSMPVDTFGGASRVSVDWYWGWWNWYSRSELRDDRVALFADYLPKGAYSYSYTFRATLPGSYHVIPTTAREAYFPEVYGRGDGQLMTISK
ncbi:MAG TPA: alpha-2-macroglobulin family protein, partial [Herpetosiphonaceae bacterium]